MNPKIETVSKGYRVGVNRDGQPVGHATRAKGKPERWTAFVYTEAVPYDYPVPGFPDADAAVAHIAEHGSTPEHLRLDAETVLPADPPDDEEERVRNRMTEEDEERMHGR